MATTSYDVTKDWTATVEGAADVNLCGARNEDVEYIVADSEPAVAAVGHLLPQRQTQRVYVGESDELYVRIIPGATDSAGTAVATDAAAPAE
ncbi:MAG: hypothetical protein AB7I50_26580 [Vicinamibacterales bacterium]